MRRKRVTADHKGTRPSDDEIRSVMQKIQQCITDNKIPVKFTLNTDETGMFYCQGLKSQWVPQGQTAGGIRASAAHSTMKSRFTAALTGAGTGDLLVQYLIMACTVGKADMSRVKVIESLHKLNGFTEGEGWKYQWWEKTLPI
eukprot:1891682-Rhodomonas_salina.1